MENKLQRATLWFRGLPPWKQELVFQTLLELTMDADIVRVRDEETIQMILQDDDDDDVMTEEELRIPYYEASGEPIID